MDIICCIISFDFMFVNIILSLFDIFVHIPAVLADFAARKLLFFTEINDNIKNVKYTFVFRKSEKAVQQMKHYKKPLAILLCAALALGACPLFAAAEQTNATNVLGLVVEHNADTNYAYNGVVVNVSDVLCVLTTGWVVDPDSTYAFYNTLFDGDELYVWDYDEAGSYALLAFADQSKAAHTANIKDAPAPRANQNVYIYYYDFSGINSVDDLENAEFTREEATVQTVSGNTFYLKYDPVGGDIAIGGLVLGADGYVIGILNGGDFHTDDFLYNCCVSTAYVAGLYPDPDHYYGDVDFDGSVTASDARLILREAVNLEEFSEGQFLLGDMDGNRVITASDARLALRTAVGLERYRSFAGTGAGA